MLNTHTLANGLRIVHTPSPTRVAYCGYAIKAGTRHELPHQQGIAHLVEFGVGGNDLRRYPRPVLSLPGCGGTTADHGGKIVIHTQSKAVFLQFPFKTSGNMKLI